MIDEAIDELAPIVGTTARAPRWAGLARPTTGGIATARPKEVDIFRYAGWQGEAAVRDDQFDATER